jgi:hypothetical protein
MVANIITFNTSILEIKNCKHSMNFVNTKKGFSFLNICFIPFHTEYLLSYFFTKNVNKRLEGMDFDQTQ